MKKTILAMAVPALLIAGAAHASVNLHNADGVVVDLSGAAEIQYIQQYNNAVDPFLRIDDADLLFTSSIQITEALSAVAGMGFKYEVQKGDPKNLALPNGDAETLNDELYVGLNSNFGTITFGRQLLIADDAGNAKDHELGTEQINFVKYSGEQVIKWLFDNGMFYAGADIDLDSNIDAPTSVTGVAVDNKGTQVIGGRLGARFQGFDARVYLYDAKNLATSDFATDSDGTKFATVQDVTGFNVEGDYTFGLYDFSASYGQVEYKGVNVTAPGAAENKNTVDTWQISAGYQANEKTYFAVGYDALTSAASGNYKEHKSSSMYANVSYLLHANAKVYAEVGVADDKIRNSANGQFKDLDPNTGYVLGMEVKF